MNKKKAEARKQQKEPTFSLKAEFSPEFVEKLATAFKDQWAPFNANSFLVSVINKDWENRELKERMRHITLMLGETLPSDYQKAIDILVKVAPQFTGLSAIIFPDFIQVFGVQHFSKSIPALQAVTEFSTSEFAVRPFIEQYGDQMIQVMLDWTTHENEHTRRLASEGCRPRLPWAPALGGFKKKPGPILPILERLRADESLYVRKSVANNLNDISKDHPDLVLNIAENWLTDNHKHTNWIVKHALRGLLKKGNKKALSLFGFGDTEFVSVSALTLDKQQLNIGDVLQFSFNMTWNGKEKVKLRLEYGIDYVKSNGKTNRKVFQLKESEFFPNKVYEFVKKQSFEQRTTRKHYPGEHQITILVNGDGLASQSFIIR